MNRHPIRGAFDYLDEEPSVAFCDDLRIRFFAEIQLPPTATGADASARADGAADREETIVTITEEPPRTDPRRKESRRRVVFGIAAAIVVIVGLTAVVINHRSQPAGIDTSRDPEVAKEALISLDELGAGWDISSGGLTSRAVADIAATVPECTPYLNYAFDSPDRHAPTAGRIFASLASYLTEWVYIFPSERAASQAMSKMAEAGFVTCFNRFLEALIPAYAPGSTVTATTTAEPPVLPHGDRQVVLTQHNTYRTGTAEFSRTVLNVFVQVGRGIVYIDPVTDERDSLDPAGSIEKALSLATNDLTAALAATPEGS